MIVAERVVILAIPDAGLRRRLSASLRAMRWQVREASGGAEAMAQLEVGCPEALLLDEWLPDLQPEALASIVRQAYPQVDLIHLNGSGKPYGVKSTRHHELLHALREAGSTSGWDGAPWTGSDPTRSALRVAASPLANTPIVPPRLPKQAESRCYLPGFVGESAPLQELARLVRLVAPHDARVLIEGETGSGKELVARAIHSLSKRAAKPLVTLNCAAIPEALLEAELFGHTKGAFTGAVQARVGRIEAADGGTLFLDEVGELPLALQAKLLRFLENGELQKIGGNEAVRVDVRILCATHRDLDERTSAGAFRLDLYHRIAVFPVEVPALRERMGDLPMLASYLIAELGAGLPKKRLGPCALQRLLEHSWPGNVRELQNALQRALILSDSRPEIEAADIILRRSRRS